MKEVVLLIGTGAIGMAIARRIGVGKHLLLADFRKENAEKTAAALIDSGFEARATSVDVTSRSSVKNLVNTSEAMGKVVGIIHAAGVPPSQSPPALILKVDLYGTAVVLEEFGKMVSEGASCVVISSQAGYQMPALSPKELDALATSPVDELLDLPILMPDQFADSYKAYQIAKKGCSLRVMAEAVRWGKRGARVNTISPGVINTPLADNELQGERGEEYQNMIKSCPAGRAGTLDEVANIGAYLLGPEAAFITGSDFLIDGGMTALYWYNKDMGP